MPITPSEAVTAAFRAAELELSREKTIDYDEWLKSTNDHLMKAAVAYGKVAQARPTSDRPTMKALEYKAYMAMLRAAVAAQIALGNFPCLRSILEPCPGENLN